MPCRVGGSGGRRHADAGTITPCPEARQGLCLARCACVPRLKGRRPCRQAAAPQGSQRERRRVSGRPGGPAWPGAHIGPPVGCVHPAILTLPEAEAAPRALRSRAKAGRRHTCAAVAAALGLPPAAPSRAAGSTWLSQPPPLLPALHCCPKLLQVALHLGQAAGMPAQHVGVPAQRVEVPAQRQGRGPLTQPRRPTPPGPARSRPACCATSASAHVEEGETLRLHASEDGLGGGRQRAAQRFHRCCKLRMQLRRPPQPRLLAAAAAAATNRCADRCAQAGCLGATWQGRGVGAGGRGGCRRVAGACLPLLCATLVNPPEERTDT